MKESRTELTYPEFTEGLKCFADQLEYGIHFEVMSECRVLIDEVA